MKQECKGHKPHRPVGPWPFVTQHLVDHDGGTRLLWSSRPHRKRLAHPERREPEALLRVFLRCLWMPGELNWWIGIIFAIGSTCFAMASLYLLCPALGVTSSRIINRIYFAGSIPFTLAAYLQLYQAANAPPIVQERSDDSRRRRLIGWNPENAGWLSCALQFVGTILFNVNTWNAMDSSMTWVQQNVWVWVPNVLGSILFLASGYLAFIETCHGYWAWRQKSLSWWIVFINLLGCLGFMVSALFAVNLSDTPDPMAVTISVFFTLQGAVCFFVGALLMLPEAAIKELDGT